MSRPTIIGIALSKYFKNHYDNWGRLYCVEYKGDPIELQNAIKRLQEENNELKEMLSKEPKAMQAFQTAYSGLKKDNEVLWGMVKDYKTALEEIREAIGEKYGLADIIKIRTILDEVLK